MMETEAEREPEKEKPRRKALSIEDLRRKYSWWPTVIQENLEDISHYK
jgi:hypothetical protein